MTEPALPDPETVPADGEPVDIARLGRSSDADRELRARALGGRDAAYDAMHGTPEGDDGG